MTHSTNIEATTRAQIADFLPDAIRLAVESYRNHMTRSDLEADFSNHHKAAKVAISHIELLIKLARWADLPDGDARDAGDMAHLSALMASAQAEVESYQDEEENAHDSY